MRIISVTPAGRRRYMEVLVEHLLRQRHVLDEHHWWLNTDVAEDIAFVRQTCVDYPDFFRVCEKRFDAALTHGDNIWKFFRNYVERNALYVRLDDDIVWMADDAIEKLVQFRLERREAPLVMGHIVNNAICTAAHQRAGLLPRLRPTVRAECCDDIGWKEARTARIVHEAFLADLSAGRADRWTRLAIPLEIGQRYSINVISWLGETLSTLAELETDEIVEELFLTEELPRRLGQANAVCTEALFAHFAFWPQRPYMDWTSSDLLQQYRMAAEQRPLCKTPKFGYWRRDATWRITKPFRKLHRSIVKRLPKWAA